MEEPISTLELTRQTIGADLLAALVDEIRQAPRAWPQLSEDAQKQVIDRLRDRVKGLVSQATELIAADKRLAMSATLDSWTETDGVKCVLKLSKACAQDLAGHARHACVLLLTEPESYFGDMSKVAPDAQQRKLDLEGTEKVLFKFAGDGREGPGDSSAKPPAPE